ncbi:hypothetical protein [uncultured Methanoregula sp.]|uniref:hypothetical protein n=1 Tax=uncultured Methanoregula sp. TaxID=1005933 RepID=UPI002AABEB5F|nr:hypothetical protein [uncultured Methanoregula sp.]
MAEGVRPAIILLILITAMAISPGCLSTVFGAPPVYNTPVIVTPSPETPATIQPVAEMALVPDDLPRSYSMKDRSIISYDETGQITRELGWMGGYRVVYLRLDHESDDITGIRQVIGIYPPESINRVYKIEREALLGQANGARLYEIPFPKIGSNSIAIRVIEPGDPRDLVVYSILFTKNNVCEQITMGGTATDYETLKSIAIRAADKIR